MKTLARVTFVLSVSHLLTISVAAQSRPSDAVARKGTISGRVTAHGKPLASVGVALQSSGAGGWQTSHRATTDAEGRYQFTGVAAGTYQINPLNPLYVLPGDNSVGIPGITTSNTITLNEGENVANVDLALIRGSVLTGKISDSEGRPLIEQDVNWERLGPVHSFHSGLFNTDDRGIYRIFGIRPGKYRVSTGEVGGSIPRGSGGKSYPLTFHPDVTDVSQATIIEVGEGSEVTGVDISLGAAVKTYAIGGRAVDAETSEPVTSGVIFAGTMSPNGRLTGYTLGVGLRTGGEFRVEGLPPGRYGVYAGSSVQIPSANYGYSDPLSVEVIDGDAMGVEIRVKRGEGTISGIAVVEGVTDPEILARLPKQNIVVGVTPRERGMYKRPVPLRIAGDGTFRAEGLRPGRVSFGPASGDEGDAGLTMLRVERDGVSVDGIEIGPGERVIGVRIVFASGNGIVRGQVIVKGGSLPEGTFFSVVAHRGDGSREKSARTDARGAFAIDGLPPGQYELEAQPITPVPLSAELQRRAAGKQTVTVTNGQLIQVTFTIDLSPREQKQ
jgi:hypothetical protein